MHFRTGGRGTVPLVREGGKRESRWRQTCLREARQVVIDNHRHPLHSPSVLTLPCVLADSGCAHLSFSGEEALRKYEAPDCDPQTYLLPFCTPCTEMRGRNAQTLAGHLSGESGMGWEIDGTA